MYDTAANCAYAKPDRVLEPGQSYALIVTTAIRDAAGLPVKADSKFTNGLRNGLNNLPVQLAGLESLLPQLSGVVASASVFTTLSATDWIRVKPDRTSLPIEFREHWPPLKLST